MKIYKWPLQVVYTQILEMPANAKILTVQMQHDTPCLWALFDETTSGLENRHIAIYGTGNPMPNEPGTYIATFQIAKGSLVFHVFEFTP